MTFKTALFIALLAGTTTGQQALFAGGAFVMGGSGGDADELPAHEVTLRPFSIDKSDVTVGAYDSCVAAGSCTPLHFDDGACVIWSPPVFKSVVVPQSARARTIPATCMTWMQARDYCRYKGKHLPTEAQWEYGARNGDDRTYAWGNEAPSPKRCAYDRSTGPRPVCSYGANSRGLCDMTGNVWQWVADYYQPDYYNQSPAADPAGPEVGRYRVIRGGGWYSSADALRARNRHWFSAEFAEVSIGFRCAQ